MNWTKELPTVDGHYWVCEPDNAWLDIVFLEINEGLIHELGEGYRPISDYSDDTFYWMGPIPEPEPPMNK